VFEVSSLPSLALSLARTALTDPHAIPDSEDVAIRKLDKLTADPRHVAYAVAKIDQALGGLRFEPGCETMADARAVIHHLASMSRAAAEDLADMSRANPAVAAVSAAASLLEAAAADMLAHGA
jgi:hypothetical protein